MKRVSLSAEASAETNEAANWYEGHRSGLGAEFLDAVEAILADISERPESFPPIRGIRSRAVIRRALLGRFPYAFVFREVGDEVRVLAVCHLKRRPGYWLARIAREPRV